MLNQKTLRHGQTTLIPFLNQEFIIFSSGCLDLSANLLIGKMVSEWVNSSITSHQQRGHTETGPGFKVSSERPEKRVIDLVMPGLLI